VASTVVLAGAFTAGIAQAQAPAAASAASAAKPASSASSAPSAPSATSKSAAAVRTPRSTVGPAWADLTPAQRQSLQPLAAQWPGMTEAHKRKWLALSSNYPRMPAAEQAKLHSRMTEWAALTPQQRSQARLNFADTKQLSPDDKKAKWQAYQSLSPEEKQKLAARAQPKPAGAAPAIKPVPPQKMTKVPRSPADPKANPQARAPIDVVPAHVDHNTLLPHPQQTSAPAAAQPN